MILSTLGDWRAFLNRYFHRYLIREEVGRLTLYLPASALTRDLLMLLVESSRPVNVWVVTERLPWWRCWFERRQVVRI
jgi:hypothetical protein